LKVRNGSEEMGLPLHDIPQMKGVIRLRQKATVPYVIEINWLSRFAGGAKASALHDVIETRAVSSGDRKKFENLYY
jgi:hypothetical protein